MRTSLVLDGRPVRRYRCRGVRDEVWLAERMLIMASQAIFGFVGVVLGSLTTSVLTIYRERLATQREIALRNQQYERDRKASRNAFQRDSILALQSAVFDMIKAAYAELD